MMNSPIRFIASRRQYLPFKWFLMLSALLYCSSLQAATRNWKANTVGLWTNAANWVEAAVPVAGDDVSVQNAGGTAIVDTATAYLSSLTVSETILFTNWNSTLSVTNLTVQNLGNITCAGPFTNNVQSNNVYIVCSNLTVESGGAIQVDGKGFAGGLNTGGTSQDGFGPGFGKRLINGHAGGAGHGGWASKWASGVGVCGLPYGSPTQPVTPGSGGSSGYDGSVGDHHGGAGGGAIRIEADGAVTVDGAITADGEKGGSVYVFGGGGSGGSIYMNCRTLEGTGGVIRVNGGHGGDEGNANGGGGGRMSLAYDSDAQGALGVTPDIRFLARPGKGGIVAVLNTVGYARKVADIGTVYFTDTYFLSATLTTNIVGQILGTNSWSVTNLTVSDTWVRFAEDNMTITVSGNVVVDGSSALLEIGGGETVIDAGWYVGTSATSGPTFNIGQNLILTNGGILVVYSGVTNETTEDYGSLVDVTGAILIHDGCAIHPHSHPNSGGSPKFCAGSVTIDSTGEIDADGKGYRGGVTWGEDGKGPGYGHGRNSDYSGGAGYGGVGGSSYFPSPGGIVYGDADAPTSQGSGGGDGYSSLVSWGGSGGGLVWLEVDGTVTLNGTISADGDNGVVITGGGGSGGGIYVYCGKITGTGTLSTVGGDSAASAAGGGGGGRIAVWTRSGNQDDFTISVTNGIGYTAIVPATKGSLVWGLIPAKGTIITIR